MDFSLVKIISEWNSYLSRFEINRLFFGQGLKLMNF